MSFQGAAVPQSNTSSKTIGFDAHNFQRHSGSEASRAYMREVASRVDVKEAAI